MEASQIGTQSTDAADRRPVEAKSSSHAGVEGNSHHETPAPRKRIALVAHDEKKNDLLEWARFNRLLLQQHELYATDSTGRLLERELGIDVTKLNSGPLGGDQQIGAKIATGEIDFLVFFWDPLQSHPHDPDVRALLRVAVVWNVPVACNRASADFMISSPLMREPYQRIIPPHQGAAVD
ncbi:MAG: methylglyoxal synthase [Bacillati bacterium ANGP1]|uniref:Methylglyoxal synthase n=1 Tax=Candidatus Segetimicrobium genomatis TaxID=2569760 RepID=A0A537K5P6_9BACT|nr:MAG: methylglyoxal synthase [Terrabacteria group bacterium ANGP1]